MSNILWAAVPFALWLYVFFRHVREAIHLYFLEGCLACCVGMIGMLVAQHGYEALEVFHHLRGPGGSGTPLVIQMFERPEMNAAFREYYLHALLKGAVPAWDAAPVHPE